MGFQQAGGAISPCLPPGLFLQQACARPQSCGSTRGELLPNTGTHTSTHRAANSEHAFWLYPHVPCLRCTQTHSDYFCPTSSHNNSPNPFRVKTQRLWLQSPSGISCCIAKLYAIKQLNISTLLVNLLLWYCKSKKCGFFFFLWWSCHCLEETCVLHTQKGTHVFHMVHCKLHRIESSWRKMAIEKWFSWASSVDLFCL